MNQRAKLLELLTDLVSPVGPEVFAGFRTEFQNKLNDDIWYGEKFKDNWEESTDLTAMLPILIDIAMNPPPRDTCFGLHIRRSQDWAYELSDLIYRAAKSNIDLFCELTKDLQDDELGSEIINEVWSWLEEEDLSST